MGNQRTSEFYDKVFSESTIYNLENIQKSPYYETWKRVIQKISKKDRIADFGCGNGQFAQLCLLNKRQYVAGYDFSEVAIQKAKELNPEIKDVFEVKDLNDKEIYKRDNFEVAVFCEVLEHIENDMEILENIPEFFQTIITVPNYDSASHVRHFQNIDEAIERYRKLFFIKDTFTINILDKNEIYILNCTKKWDSH